VPQLIWKGTATRSPAHDRHVGRGLEHPGDDLVAQGVGQRQGEPSGVDHGVEVAGGGSDRPDQRVTGAASRGAPDVDPGGGARRGEGQLRLPFYVDRHSGIVGAAKRRPGNGYWESEYPLLKRNRRAGSTLDGSQTPLDRDGDNLVKQKSNPPLRRLGAVGIGLALALVATPAVAASQQDFPPGAYVADQAFPPGPTVSQDYPPGPTAAGRSQVA
jgi:hypothetical protein